MTPSKTPPQLPEAVARYRAAHEAVQNNPAMLLSDPSSGLKCAEAMQELELARMAMFDAATLAAAAGVEVACRHEWTTVGRGGVAKRDLACMKCGQHRDHMPSPASPPVEGQDDGLTAAYMLGRYDARKSGEQRHSRDVSSIGNASAITPPEGQSVEQRARELPPTEEWLLRGMVLNYGDGTGDRKHQWDHLDRNACQRAAEEIAALRAALSAQAPSADGRKSLAKSIMEIPVPTKGFHEGWRDEEIWEWALRAAGALILNTSQTEAERIVFAQAPSEAVATVVRIGGVNERGIMAVQWTTRYQDLPPGTKLYAAPQARGVDHG